MRFFTATLLFPALIATATAAGKGPAILRDLDSILTALENVNSTVSKFKPNQLLGVLTALKIEGLTNKLGDALEQGVSDAQATSPIGSKNTNAIASRCKLQHSLRNEN